MSDQKLMVMRTIWGALLGGTVMMFVVGYAVTSERQEALSPEAMLLPVFAVLALSMAGGSVFLPPFLLRQALAGLKLATTDVPSPGPSTRRRGKRFVDPQSIRSRLVMVAQPSFIIGMALSEAVAILGFVLWFLGFEVTLVIPFFVVCWGLMLSKFPRLATFEHTLQSVYDADLA
jgi:hypothetical protein